MHTCIHTCMYMTCNVHMYTYTYTYYIYIHVYQERYMHSTCMYTTNVYYKFDNQISNTTRVYGGHHMHTIDGTIHRTTHLYYI